jgi:hypothetical protein
LKEGVEYSEIDRLVSHGEAKVPEHIGGSVRRWILLQNDSICDSGLASSPHNFRTNGRTVYWKGELINQLVKANGPGVRLLAKIGKVHVKSVRTDAWKAKTLKLPYSHGIIQKP